MCHLGNEPDSEVEKKVHKAMTKSEIVKEIIGQDVCFYSENDHPFNNGLKRSRKQLERAIPSLLWIARSEEEIRYLIDQHNVSNYLSNEDMDSLAHSLFEWLKGEK